MSTKQQVTRSSTPGADAGDSSFGRQVRTRRKELGLSLEELAQRTGLTASFLSLVERNMSNPSLDSLRAIADALAVPPFYFSQDSHAVQSAVQNPVVRADSRVRITFPPGNVTSELLVPNLRNRLEVFITHVQPSAGNVARTPQMDTEECILVLSGMLRVALAEQEYILHEGDSIYLQGFTLREISAHGGTEAVFLSAITPPVF